MVNQIGEMNKTEAVRDGQLISPPHLAPDAAIVDLQARTRWSAIHEILQSFRDHPAIKDLQRWEDDIVRREKLQPTDIMNEGIAFPHARTNAVREIIWGIGISKAGIPFRSADSLVHIIVLIGIPETMIREYLEFMGQLTRLLRSHGVIDELMTAKTNEQLLARLSIRNPEK